VTAPLKHAGCRGGLYRACPSTPALLETLDMVHGICVAQARPGSALALLTLHAWST
jgi:hypothetical protein